MSTLKVDTISEKTASGGITFSQDITATLSSSSNVKAPLNASGDAPVYACRAWVNFNGTGTVSIRASGNVSSITDNGTGDYTVNFTTAMEDDDYACLITGVNRAPTSTNGYTIGYRSSDAINATTYSTTAVRINNKQDNVTTPQDVNPISVAVFR
jgi:hypothetical protein